MIVNAFSGVAAGFFLIAVTFGFIRQAMKSESFGRNRAIGIRTRATLASDDAWSRGHKASAPWVLATAIAAAVIGLATLTLGFAGDESSVAVVIVIFGGFASVLACVIVCAVVANRAAMVDS